MASVSGLPKTREPVDRVWPFRTTSSQGENRGQPGSAWRIRFARQRPKRLAAARSGEMICTTLRLPNTPGGVSARAESVDQLETALHDALADDGPALVKVMTDPEPV